MWSAASTHRSVLGERTHNKKYIYGDDNILCNVNSTDPEPLDKPTLLSIIRRIATIKGPVLSKINFFLFYHIVQQLMKLTLCKCDRCEQCNFLKVSCWLKEQFTQDILKISRIYMGEV